MSPLGQTGKSKLVSDMSASASIAEERRRPAIPPPIFGGLQSESSELRRTALRRWTISQCATTRKVHILFDHLIE